MLNPTGIFKERLSQSALVAAMRTVSDEEAQSVRRWLDEEFDPSPIDSRAVNDALKVVCHALDPHTAFELCLSSAEAVDAEFDALTADQTRQLEEHAAATETQFRMNRSLHRDGHLDDIEALLSKQME